MYTLEALADALRDETGSATSQVAGRASAAVLVPLYERAGDVVAVFTRRRDDLRHHPGQISFPGGQRDPADATLLDTALREAHEEIGLAPSAVAVLGALTPIYVPASGFAVSPFVAKIERPARWTPAEGEVEEILELALRPLARSFVKCGVAPIEGRPTTPTYAAGEHLIWGATARILGDLLERMRSCSG